MRMLMKWTLGTREASEAIRSGRIAEVNKTLDVLTKPEAQYFGTEVDRGPVTCSSIWPIRPTFPRSQNHCSKNSTQRSSSFRS